MNIRRGGGQVERFNYVVITLLASTVFVLLGTYNAYSGGEPFSPVQQYPPESGRLISLPQLNDSGGKMVLEALMLRFEGEKGYAPAPEDIYSKLPSPPEQVSKVFTLSRISGNKTLNVIRLGIARVPSQPPSLWVFGIVSESDVVSINPDIMLVDKALGDILQSSRQTDIGIPVTALEKRIIKLSYIDVDGALLALKSMGINVKTADKAAPQSSPFPTTAWTAPGSWPANAPNQGMPPVPLPPAGGTSPAPKVVNNEDLPIVVSIPGPSDVQAGLVGSSDPAAGSFGQAGAAAGMSAMAAPSFSSGAGQGLVGFTSLSSAATKLASDMVASPASQLMVMFNPRYPEQFSLVKKAIDEVVDKPARQVYVEGMVLEISKDGLDQLGVQWQLQHGFDNIQLGTLTAGVTGANTVNYTRNSQTKLAGKTKYEIQLQALIQEGKASILSRPSILTLDNRQATIRVGTDIPIATSSNAATVSGTGSVAFSFQYVPTGILLNLRPRVSSDGKEVSMIIDTTVSATVAGQDLQMLGESGQILASAPTISTRRVQTYARILNETPLIIGGLVSHDNTVIKDKVPFLGDLPLLGKLFSSSTTTTSKDEVIIVLTPYILSEQQTIARTMPKDDDDFDSFGTELFRESYRLRTEDVFDSRFIRTNKRLQNQRSLVEDAISCNPQIQKRPPFNLVAEQRIPGENALVIGMIYGMLDRLNRDVPIPLDRMVYFENKGEGEFQIQSVEQVLAALGKGKNYQSFFENRKGYAVALTFINSRKLLDNNSSILDEPAPQISLVKCKDREEWAKVLWEMNQRLPDGKERYTILIMDESDLARLNRTIAVKRFISVNDGEENATIQNYHIGKMVQFPEIKPQQNHLLEARVAKYFYYSRHYFQAFSEEMERALGLIDDALKSREVSSCSR